MKSLYQIETEYVNIISQLEASEGELTPELEAALQINRQELQTKGVNYALVILDYEGREEAIDNQIKRLQVLKKSYQSKAKILRDRIDGAMKMYGVDKIESDIVKLSYRKSEAVEVENEDLVPESCMVVKREVSKTALKEYLKAGNEVPGCAIVTKYNLQIK